jgi:hypothetical protein
MSTRTEEIDQYAQRVRDALADVPEPDRGELLEDLEEHLAEISVETDQPLENRLGTPEEYAAELRAAYGPGAARLPRPTPAAAVRSAREWLGEEYQRREGYQVAARYLKGLLPVWWLVRAFLVTQILFAAAMRFLPLPDQDHTYWALLVVVGAASVLLGMRGGGERKGMRWGVVLVVNLAALGAAYALLYSGSGNDAVYMSPQESGTGFANSTGTRVTNIFPYSRDGKPLKDVLLYDQDGQPLVLNGEGVPQQCGSLPPIRNAFPLPREEQGECAPVSPSPAPTPTGTGRP